MKLTLTFFFYFLCYLVFIPPTVLSRTPRIGIIGGGIGGTSCAYFLRELFQEEISISLFEKGAIGGRLSIIDMDGKYFEAGGSIIHPKNQYMAQFTKLLNLPVHQPSSGSLGIYNGEKFVFEESDWFVFTLAKLIWHYGLSVFHLSSDVKTMLNDFSRIYMVQQKGYSFTTVDKLLDSMNPVFSQMTQLTLSEYLRHKGYSEKFLEEFIQAIMMVNYGQTNNISAFAGHVSLAGAEGQLWSVEGGNKLVPEGLLKLAKTELLQSTVLEVEHLPDSGTFLVTYRDGKEQVSEVKSELFDVVILSAPLIEGHSDIRFVNFSVDFHQFERPYHQTVATFVKGRLNPLAFNQQSVPGEILVNNDNFLFNCVAKNNPVSGTMTGSSKVYKIFSQRQLSKQTLDKYFKQINLVKEKVWLAYPHYSPPEKMVPFVLQKGLYYVNAVELSASAMEMSALAAKNVALLVFNELKNTLDKIDPPGLYLKDEL